MRRELPPGGPRGDLDRQVREEIELHLEERAREFEEMGMEPAEALAEAQRAFGDVERIEAQMGRIRRKHGRDMGRWMMMEGLRQDLRLAVRGVLRRPGFAAVVVATLGLGIGAVTAVFSVVNAALLDSLPFAEADRLVFIQGAFDAPEGPQVRGASFPEFRDWQEQSRSFEVMAAVDGGTVALSGAEGAPMRLQTELVGPGYFQALRVEPLLGRVFTPREMRVPGGEAVALLAETLWDGRFGRDTDVVGKAITLNGAPFTVVGVLRDEDRGTSLEAELWVPLAAPTVGVGPDATEQRGSRFLGVVARLAPGLEAEAAQVEMSSIATRLQDAYPDSHEDRIALVTPLREAYLGDTGTLVLLVLSASGLLLLIAGANVANLLLVRSTGRGSEVVLKKALGASRGRLVSQFLTESMVLAGLGAILGLVLGAWGARGLIAAMPAALLPPYVEVTLDGRVFLVTVAVMAAVGLLSGVTPAFLTAGANLADGLREAGRGSLNRSRARVQRAFVAAQIALALI
ncbi:MAG: FtsX-like permease family protein, partial [Gemmatimonadetes bacterium]|nr:FtsX-like permease family protein [Gemmatimonadota bacterium]